MMHQLTTGRKFNLLLIGTPLAPSRPTQGGPGRSPVRELRNTLAHELGHSLGLNHNPGEVATLPPLVIGGAVNPVYVQPVYHNLMFPVNIFCSSRLNRDQVEILHLTQPPYRLRSF